MKWLLCNHYIFVNFFDVYFARFSLMFQFGANLTDFGFLYIDLFLLTPLGVTCKCRTV